ncbi:2-hydroxychromene-2-carboxylate isomerase [Denitromonas iodatirespirans]|uniref:2-hydroxychromene-2-carboxylate isomerase n=1 Tax=Denitromonas iodatirespirans TaxID=2795389 RepID=A0A944HC07_DENI1|nr:2-hydroxychromene-2-carboxylate isomerase [Denitromonas iodatirespirans]MBT0962212.1 2-hydroxychromene-2-carboxylate isomerase [Denitromonas iodatirespirans]
MPQALDYYFVLNSPWSYLAARQLGGIVERTGAELRLRPVQLPKLFAATGGLQLRDRPPARQAYRLQELARWSRHLGVPMHIQPTHFPVDERLAVGAVLAALAAGHEALPLTVAFGQALWTDNRNLADEAVVADLLASANLPASLLAEARDPRHDATLAANTEATIAANVFGVPSCVIGNEVFWGQDRLDFVERALTQPA